MSFSKQRIDDQFADAEDSSIEEVFTVSPRKIDGQEALWRNNEVSARNSQNPPLWQPRTGSRVDERANLPPARMPAHLMYALSNPPHDLPPQKKAPVKSNATSAVNDLPKSGSNKAKKLSLKSAMAKAKAKKLPSKNKVKKRLLKHVKVQNLVKQVKSCYVNAIPTWQVHTASRLVAQALRMFPESSPGVHLQAAVTVENFGKQVFLPYIMAQAEAAGPSGLPAPCGDRIFFATLMALREVLAQNAHTIFQLPSPPSPAAEAAADGDDPTDEANGHENQKEDLEEESAYARLLLATAVVMTACESGGKNPERLLEMLQQEQNAAYPADRASGTWRPKAPNGELKPLEEAMAWKVGYNLAQKDRAERQESYRVSLPKPTACWIDVVEQIPVAFKKGNLNEI